MDLFQPHTVLDAIDATTNRPRIPRRAQRVHAHSVAARVESLHKLGRRAASVLLWLKDHGQHTDREVMRGMGFTDMNAVRPRITELIDAKLVEEVGETVDPTTRKTVRIVRAKVA